MKSYVVDTNVAVVANGRETHADLDCEDSCIDALIEVQESGEIVIDDGMLILNEYRKHLSISGQPGMGDAFMEWLWENQAVPERCERVTLTPLEDSSDDFEEFPRDPDLNTFDPSDRKFVAVARASKNRPTILNAVDRDWWEHKEALKRNGIRVRFLCQQHMS